MPKIRDLGITGIPATMRPLDIGLGGGRLGEVWEMMPGDCSGCSPVDASKAPDCAPSCPQHSCKAPSAPPCPPPSNQKYTYGGLTPDAVMLLKQQLRDRIDTGLHA